LDDVVDSEDGKKETDGFIRIEKECQRLAHDPCKDDNESKAWVSV
jgi:hypothetical protein